MDLANTRTTAYFGLFSHDDTYQEAGAIVANREGLEAFAKELLRIANGINDTEELDESIYLDLERFSFFDQESTLIINAIEIIKNPPLTSSETVKAESRKEKIFGRVMGGVLLLLPFFCLLGIIQCIAWLLDLF